jgi:GrpB-like predicted nucleotidyltransferase (UPF0157 family)
MPLQTVTIVEHKTTWRGEFEAIAADLAAVLRSQALRIDHIGSTAVPGLAAKDIIDVQVTVPRLDGAVSDLLLAAGFGTHKSVQRQDHLPPGFEPHASDWAKQFFMQRPGERRCNIHVRQAGKPNQRYALLVRDFLRAESRTAQAYGQLKLRLAAGLADPDRYPEVKDPVADIIYLAAERWAHANSWNPEVAGVA